MATAVTDSPAVDLAAVNASLASASAEDRVAWAASAFGDSLVLSSSFGAQAAVMLSLATRVVPGIPVVLIDTGYLFPETYRFADELAAKLKLNLKVYRAELTPAWIEARHGKLWEQGLDGLKRYNQLVKVEPMQRALRDLGPRPDRLLVPHRGRLVPVAVADIIWIRSEGDYARIHTVADRTYLVARTMNELEARLDPAQFLRIHRTAIIRTDRIREVVAEGSSRYRVILDGAPALIVSRGRAAALRKWIL